jgi:aspartate kinase
MSLVVMKFGGKSVGSAERMLEVAGIVGAAYSRGQVVVVVPAMAKVTDLLLAAAAAAEHADREGVAAHLAQLREIHQQCARDLRLDALAQRALAARIDARLAELEQLLVSIAALSELTPRALDLIAAYGERLSVHLVAAALKRSGTPAEPADAARLIVTTERHSAALPLLNESSAKARPRIATMLARGDVPVVTGFIGATPAGVLTTLGRGGSDYSATILAYCIDADEVQIFTDSGGFMTADPRFVPRAETIARLSYKEAAELAHSGAGVLHPLTCAPAARKRIPLFVKGTGDPSAPGTKITGAAVSATGPKAVTVIKDVALLGVRGRDAAGASGAAKFIAALAAEEIRVLLIAQASSGYSISAVVPARESPRAVQTLNEAFRTELGAGGVEDVSAEDGLSLVALVGESMRGQPGIAGTCFAALGSANINIRAIAQDSLAHNLSLIVPSADLAGAVAALHDAFHLRA